MIFGNKSYLQKLIVSHFEKKSIMNACESKKRIENLIFYDQDDNEKGLKTAIIILTDSKLFL